MADFVEVLPTPGPEFDFEQFFMKGQILVSTELAEYIESAGKKVPNTDEQRIKLAASNAPVEQYPPGFWKSLHRFRGLRNVFAHELRPNKIVKRSNDFAREVEKFAGYKGHQLFPLKDPANQCHWRVYFAFAHLWDGLTGLNGVEKEKPLFTELFEAYVRALESADRGAPS